MSRGNEIINHRLLLWSRYSRLMPLLTYLFNSLFSIFFIIMLYHYTHSTQATPHASYPTLHTLQTHPLSSPTLVMTIIFSGGQSGGLPRSFLKYLQHLHRQHQPPTPGSMYHYGQNVISGNGPVLQSMSAGGGGDGRGMDPLESRKTIGKLHASNLLLT